MSGKLKLVLASGTMGLAIAAQAADPLICNISQCTAFSPAAVNSFAGAKLDNWARNEIWSITEEILQVVGLQPNSNCSRPHRSAMPRR